MTAAFEVHLGPCAPPAQSIARCTLFELLGSKWSALTLDLLYARGVARFGELQQSLPGVGAKMLTRTLRRLEAVSLVDRTVYAEVPPRVEYELTELGVSLAERLASIQRWFVLNVDTPELRLAPVRSPSTSTESPSAMLQPHLHSAPSRAADDIPCARR